jgi:hypothetical protein
MKPTQLTRWVRAIAGSAGNTITGGRNGVAGTDGWYFHKW